MKELSKKHRKMILKDFKEQGKMTANVEETSTWLTESELTKGLGKNCRKNWSKKGETMSEWL